MCVGLAPLAKVVTARLSGCHVRLLHGARETGLRSVPCSIHDLSVWEPTHTVALSGYSTHAEAPPLTHIRTPCRYKQDQMDFYKGDGVEDIFACERGLFEEPPGDLEERP